MTMMRGNRRTKKSLLAPRWEGWGYKNKAREDCMPPKLSFSGEICFIFQGKSQGLTCWPRKHFESTHNSMNAYVIWGKCMATSSKRR